MDKHIPDLINLGLTEGEAKVYVALLQTGSSTVGPIVKASSVASSNIYEILERLIEKGIVSFVIKSKTKYFQAAPPTNIGDYINKRKAELDRETELFQAILPDLKKITAEQSNYAEVFVGIKGLRTAYEKLLYGAKRGSTLQFLYHPPPGKISEFADSFYLKYYDASMLHLGLKTIGICPTSYRKSRYAKESVLANMRYVDFPIPMNIDILGDKVLVTSWGDSKTTVGILIETPRIADQFRKYFYAMWGTTKP